MVNFGLFDIVLGFIGIAFAGYLTFYIFLKDLAKKVQSLRFYIAFSFLTSIFLMCLLLTRQLTDYVNIYLIAQSFAYLLEIMICIQLAMLVMKNNWQVTAIFMPVLFTLMLLFVIIFGPPKTVRDMIYPGYAATMLCGLILFIVWMIEGRFESKLTMPYSGIVFSVGLYMALRFMVMYIHHVFICRHWNIIGRLYPLNEILFLVMIYWSLRPIKSNIIPMPARA